MKIIILNLTQGLVDRGLERVVDLYSQALSQNNLLTVIQAGPVNPRKSYNIIRTMKLDTAPQVAPYNIFEKLLFRLESDPSSLAVIDFTKASLSTIKKIKPDIVIACNGAPQIKILKREIPFQKIVAFGQAGLGHHDLKTLLSKPDLFIALTDAQAAWCKKYVSSSTKLVVIPNPVDISKVSKKVNLKLPRPVVLTVGALSRYKNVTRIAKTLKLLPLTHIIIGDGEERNQLQDILSKRSYDFHWIKHVSPDEMSAYYNYSDVFCFTPDPREAFGNVYIEAMAAGLPIVATDDPIRREIIGRAGYFVNPNDDEAIIRLTIKAAEGGRVDYSAMLSRYDIKVVSKLLEKALNELIEQ